MFVRLLTVGALAVTVAAAHADHIPGHDAADPTFPMPIPGQDTFSGGGSIIFVLLIGPDDGTTITNTTFDITYVSDGVTPAADLLLELQVPVNGEVLETTISGAELGFGSGPGTYRGTLTTDLFNGVVDGGLMGSAVVELGIGATTGPIDGLAYFEDSFVTFDVIPPGGTPADLNDDRLVNAADLALLLGAWNTRNADLTGDGTTNAADLAILLGAWTLS